jgi:septal ring factor EnvC (AmiA/AmiB activator)
MAPALSKVPPAGRLAIAAGLALGVWAADAAETTTPAPNSPAALEALKQRNQELEAIRAEQRKATEAEQKLTAESDALAEARRKLNQSLIETAARVRAGEEQIAAAELHLRQLETGEADIRASLNGRRAVITEVLAALQRIGHRPPPAVFTGAQDAIESMRTAMSLGAVLPEMRGETEHLLVQLGELGRMRNEAAAERARIAGQLAQLGAERASVAALIEERQHRKAEVDQAAGSERQKALALARQADSLKDLIGKLEQSLDETRSVRGAARPGDETKPPTSQRPGLAALGDPARLAPAVAFASSKGKLLLPSSGVKIRDFGAPDGMGGNEKGISLATRAGAQVTAPSDGWVVYAAPYRSYGQLLILNVGGGYHVLLAGMERITVDLGQFVLTGEPVAVMGSGTQVASSSASGSMSMIGASQPVLYIEFRKDGNPVDSNPWWAATDKEKVRG